jgi:hypothetical protein
LEIKRHAGRIRVLTANAHLPDDVIWEGQRCLPERRDRARIEQIDEHPWRAVEALVVKPSFAVEFEREAERIRQCFPSNEQKRDGLTSCCTAGQRAGAAKARNIGVDLSIQRARRKTLTECFEQPERDGAVRVFAKRPVRVRRESRALKYGVVGVPALGMGVRKALVLTDDCPNPVEQHTGIRAASV